MVMEKENFSKMSLEELEELYGRQKNILKNKSIVNKLHDKGAQLQQKLEKVEKEIKMRKDMEEIEGNMKNLTIVTKYAEYICNKEKSPKERYKPFATLKENKSKKEKLTQLIPLAESLTLLVEQTDKLPVERVKNVIEGSEMAHKEESDIED